MKRRRRRIDGRCTTALPSEYDVGQHAMNIGMLFKPNLQVMMNRGECFHTRGMRWNDWATLRMYRLEGVAFRNLPVLLFKI
mmetsp:Transcript_160881/g.283469  ORF Transcript_160881/g.283469 Transcript_160881/m.283469 type:complete len:81 (+) Transcript_160881:1136-1378(+)